MPDAQLQCRLPIAESFAAEYLEYYRLLPLELTEHGLRVAIAGEPQEEALDDLRTSYGASLELIPVTDEELQTAIRQTFAAAESVVELVRDLSADASLESGRADDAPTDVRDLANQPPVIRFVNLLIREAHAATASDIHLEATREVCGSAGGPMPYAPEGRGNPGGWGTGGLTALGDDLTDSFGDGIGYIPRA